MPASCRESGFSLIEVLIALAIVGLALAAAAGTFSAGLLGHEAARDAAIALAVAEGKLAEAGVATSLKPGESAGNYGGRFDWQIAVSPYDDPSASRAATPLQATAGDASLNPPAPPAPDDFLAPTAGATAGFRLFRIAVSVSWRDGRRRRELALATLRLVSNPP